MTDKTDYSDWPKEDLVKEIKKLKEKKKYGIVWNEEKTKEEFDKESEGKLPVLKEVKSNEIQTDNNSPTNILIEGDNYHSLSVLNYTHAKRVDVIYIDPPFNKGSESLRYNNKFVEKDDPYKHSKWLSFMYKRLRLAKKLLKKDGALIVAIDDFELNHLGLILEEIFQNYVRDLIVIIHHPQGAGSDTISTIHEYAYVLTPPKVGLLGRRPTSKEGNWSLKRTGQGENNWRKNRPKQFFAIIVNEKDRQIIGVGPEIKKDDKHYPKGKTVDGYLRIYPFDKEGKERAWRYNRQTMSKYIEEKKIEYTPRGALVVKKSVVAGTPIFSVWTDSKYNAGTHGSSLLTQIMGVANTFPYPKSIYNVKDLLAMIIQNNTTAIVLDFFGGSGTTGHAVLELNDEDDGNRKFILCTNNENEICTEVCYPRVKKVIQGYSNLKNEKVKGLGGNLKYFKTDFVDGEPTDKNKKKLVEQCTEMLCLKEDRFDEIKQTKTHSIFKNHEEKYLGIIYDDDGIEPLKKQIKSLGKKFNVYVFSLDDSAREEEFEDVKGMVDLKPIPEVILNVYRRIFK